MIKTLLGRLWIDQPYSFADVAENHCEVDGKWGGKHDFPYEYKDYKVCMRCVKTWNVESHQYHGIDVYDKW